MEWFEWAFILPITGWLVREVWSNISQTKFMRKQSENEHQYFKKRLIFEQKSEVYRECYKRAKHMAGVLNDFNFFEERTLTPNMEAIESYIRLNNLDEHKDYIKIYEKDIIFRFGVNLDYYLGISQEVYMEFKNYVAEQNYILSEEENIILAQMDITRNELRDYINQIEPALKKEDPEEILCDCKNHFGEEYSSRFEEMNQLLYEFSDTIRKEMFL